MATSLRKEVMNTKQSALEGVKELCRTLFFACLTAAVMYGYTYLNGNYDPSSIQFVLGTVLLRGLDSFVHHNDSIPVSTLSPTDVLANKIAE